jgi:hypothetical protein
MNAQMYLPREGDREIIISYIEDFRKMEDAQLHEQTEQKKKLGMFGAHQQTLNLIAFNIVMKERFNDSPLIIEDNCLIRFKVEGEK